LEKRNVSEIDEEAYPVEKQKRDDYTRKKLIDHYGLVT